MKDIKLQFYPRHVYITTDIEELNRHVEERLDENTSYGYTAPYVDFHREFNLGVIIFINLKAEENKTSYGLAQGIAHECLHAVNMIFLELGIKYNTEYDEHAAYLLGFLVSECHKYISSIVKNS